jgi:hypothetical protein
MKKYKTSRVPKNAKPVALANNMAELKVKVFQLKSEGYNVIYRSLLDGEDAENKQYVIFILEK